MGAGHTIYFRLHFNVDVIVRNDSDASWPELELETSAYHSSVATYVGGSGSTILRCETPYLFFKALLTTFFSFLCFRFKYLTINDDYTADLDYVASPYSLTGGEIITDSDYPSTPINRTLPRNGAPGSLGIESRIGIDTTPPCPIEVVSAMPPGMHGLELPPKR